MKLHEYQAKALLKQFGASIPEGGVATTLKEAVRVWRATGSGKVAIKAQIHAGGRGQGGGIKLAETEPEVRAAAAKILGMTLVTRQTGPEGRLVRSLLVEEALPIEREFYAAVTLDLARGTPLLMVSASGGMSIEEIAERDPKAIMRAHFHPFLGLTAHRTRELSFKLGLHGKQMTACARLFATMARIFQEKDASLVEVNPVAVLADGRVVAADAKMVFEETALYRHEDIAELRDEAEEDPAEFEAHLADLSYVKLDGAIGCMVNGAGLAMATMDILKHFGGAPANFLDIGGRAKRDRVTRAMKIILSDPNVKGVFVNIFGGIVRCDEVAHGLIAAREELEIKVPITIRLTGTNDEEGRRLLAAAGFTTGVDLAETAQAAVRSIQHHYPQNAASPSEVIGGQ
jgi:succinyl-CoA synthetase beta subunit